MIRTTVKVDGMKCPMCEARVNDAVREALDVSKVTSSHKRGQTIIFSEKENEAKAIRDVIGAAGFTVTDIESDVVDTEGQAEAE